MIKWDLGLKWLSLLGVACNSWQEMFKRKKENTTFNFNTNQSIKHKLMNYWIKALNLTITIN